MIDAPPVGSEVVITELTDPPLVGQIASIVGYEDDAQWRVTITTSGNAFRFEGNVMRKREYLSPPRWVLVDGKIRPEKEGP